MLSQVGRGGARHSPSARPHAPLMGCDGAVQGMVEDLHVDSYLNVPRAAPGVVVTDWAWLSRQVGTATGVNIPN